MICQICGREAELHPHHLIPQKIWKRIMKNKGWKKMLCPPAPVIQVCDDCEKTIHALFKLKELAKKFNTLEKLKNEERVKKYVLWVKNKPVGVVIHIKRAWKGGKYD
jgi:hypothetical protein